VPNRLVVLILSATLLLITFGNSAEPENVNTNLEGKLLSKRIVLLGSVISETNATEIIAKLLFLEHESATKPVTIYINSPGGHATAGLAILQTIQSLKPKVFTICKGKAHSMAAIILAGGSPGCRSAFSDAKITFSNIQAPGKITEEQKGHLVRLQTTLIEATARSTGMSIEQVRELFTASRTLDPAEALKLGIIDKVQELPK
jgi:ATP-dependent Clp protease protease subunit